MITIRDNRKGKDYKPQIRDLNIGEFFEYENELYVLVTKVVPLTLVALISTQGVPTIFVALKKSKLLKT